MSTVGTDNTVGMVGTVDTVVTKYKLLKCIAYSE